MVFSTKNGWILSIFTRKNTLFEKIMIEKCCYICNYMVTWAVCRFSKSWKDSSSWNYAHLKQKIVQIGQELAKLLAILRLIWFQDLKNSDLNKSPKKCPRVMYPNSRRFWNFKSDGLPKCQVDLLKTYWKGRIHDIWWKGFHTRIWNNLFVLVVCNASITSSCHGIHSYNFSSPIKKKQVFSTCV